MSSQKSEKSIKNKCLDFVKYNNAFVIGLVLVLFGGGVIFAASPEARSAVVGREVVTAQGVDNSQILNANLDNFDFQMKIDNVTENDTNYYVDYSFRTIGIEGNEWQTIIRNLQMVVAKDALAGQDLGLYVQAQLANIAQNELAYLELAQTAEKEKGLTQIVRTTEYTGLIGLVLDVKNAVLPGYDPVVKPEPVELAQNTEPQTPQDPEILKPGQIENATTTEEVATKETQGEAKTGDTTQTQTGTPETGDITATSTTEGQTATMPTKPEIQPESQAEKAARTIIASEISTPDLVATSTAEQ